VAKKKEDSWRNRIVGEGDEDPEQLLANPDNWRVHPKAQQEPLGEILGEVGWVTRIIVNKTTGHVVDGHLRVQLALRRGEKSVPVTYVELTEDEEMLILATLDPISAMATTDTAKLDSILQGLKKTSELDLSWVRQKQIPFGTPKLQELDFTESAKRTLTVSCPEESFETVKRAIVLAVAEFADTAVY